jgi:NAD(P)-dependent dehydrogenase (short-subunit alcohol dehydrogenase family)
VGFPPDGTRAGLSEQTAQDVGRLGRPGGVALTVLHLLQDTFVTDAVLHVDGGGTL